MNHPGKTNPERMAHELGYWTGGGAKVYDLHLNTYVRHFPMRNIDYARECILDVGSGARSVFERIAPPKALITPYDVLADEYNRLAPDNRFKIVNRIDADSQFSLITLFNMLDHVDDPDDLLAFIGRHLADGGRIWVAVHLYRPHDNAGHPQKFTCRSIISLLAGHFSIESGKLIPEGIPLPYMWLGVLRSKGCVYSSRSHWVALNYSAYLRMQAMRIFFKGIKTLGIRAWRPKDWKFSWRE